MKIDMPGPEIRFVASAAPKLRTLCDLDLVFVLMAFLQRPTLFCGKPARLIHGASDRRYIVTLKQKCLAFALNSCFSAGC